MMVLVSLLISFFTAADTGTGADARQIFMTTDSMYRYNMNMGQCAVTSMDYTTVLLKNADGENFHIDFDRKSGRSSIPDSFLPMKTKIYTLSGIPRSYTVIQPNGEMVTLANTSLKRIAMAVSAEKFTLGEMLAFEAKGYCNNPLYTILDLRHSATVNTVDAPEQQVIIEQ